MTDACRPHVQACAMRVTALEPNGVPDPGTDTMVVTDNLIRFGVTVDRKEGKTYEVPNACGRNIVNFKDCDRINRLNFALQIGIPDPYLMTLLSQGSSLLTASGGRVGWSLPALNAESCPNGISIELWTKRVTEGGALDPDFPYGHWIFPMVFLTLNEATFEDEANRPTFSGFGVENSNFYNGPGNDWPTDSDRAMAFIPSANIPDPTCGYTTLTAS